MTQTALIVGASRGIGASLARELAARGFQLGLLARNQEQLQALAAELRLQFGVRVETAALDVCASDTVAPVLENIMQRFERIDVLIANAGVLGWRRAGDGNVAEDRRIIETNLIGAIAVIDPAVAQFKRQKGGHVVAISSISAMLPMPFMSRNCWKSSSGPPCIGWSWFAQAVESIIAIRAACRRHCL